MCDIGTYIASIDPTAEEIYWRKVATHRWTRERGRLVWQWIVARNLRRAAQAQLIADLAGSTGRIIQ